MGQYCEQRPNRGPRPRQPPTEQERPEPAVSPRVPRPSNPSGPARSSRVRVESPYHPAVGEEPAFREAVLRHRSVTNADEYEGVWSLLGPIARAAPTVAIRVAGPALNSLDPSERAVAADLLGLVAGLHAIHRTAIVRRLVVRSKTEQDDDVRWSLAMASAHSADARTLAVLKRVIDSPDPDVRFQVAQATAAFADHESRDSAVRLMLALAGDQDEGVRAAATEALETLGRLGRH